MKKLGVFTTGRAEFGIFSALLRELEEQEYLQYMLFVGGSHLAPEYGHTIDEILDGGYPIADKFDFLLNSSDALGLTQSVSLAVSQLAHIFNKHDFEAVVVLGDRFELLAIINAAILFKKAIIHLHGGERSEGVIDEQIRHMITKASHLHFASCEEYAENIRRMGESSWRVFNTGALSVDNMVKIDKISKDKLFKILNLKQDLPTILLTYHPVTLEFQYDPLSQIENVFQALKAFHLQVVITAPNMDEGSNLILDYMKSRVKSETNYHYFDSLGVINYLSLMSYSSFLMGNSSSGIIEAPFFRIPTLNIGNRQDGRVRHASIIDTDYSSESIQRGISKALSKDFLQGLKNMYYKFGDGKSASKMLSILKGITVDQNLMRKQLDFGDK